MVNISDIHFSPEDPWVLLSIIHKPPGRAGGAPLPEIIAIGDWINHAIFNYEELDGGLSRLIKAGYVIYERDRFRASSEITAVFSKISDKYPTDQMEELRKFLKAPPVESGHVSRVDGPAQVVTREAFDAAVKSYLDRHK